MLALVRSRQGEQRSRVPQRTARERRTALTVALSLVTGGVAVAVAVSVLARIPGAIAAPAVPVTPLPTGTSTPPQAVAAAIQLLGSGAPVAPAPPPPPPRVRFSYPDFATPAGLRLNGSAQVQNGRLVLCHDPNTAGSAWSTTRINPKRSFVTSFTTQITKISDGVALVVQGQGPTALGSAGGGIGYGHRPGDATSAISPSLAIELDTWDNGPDGFDPQGQHIAVTTGGDITKHLASHTPGFSMYGDTPVDVTIAYNAVAHLLTVYAAQHTAARTGTPADLLIVDKVAPLFTYAIDLSHVVGAEKAYIGFTAGTGTTSVTDAQESIAMWAFREL